MLQADTALSASVKMASLKEEVVRRLKYTSKRLGFSKRLETLEDLCQRMTNSGHKLRYMKQILIAGIMRFEARLKNRNLKRMIQDTDLYTNHQEGVRESGEIK